MTLPGRPRRVALVSLHHDPGWTDPDAFVAGDETRRGLADALARRGLDVHVVVEAAFTAVRSRPPSSPAHPTGAGPGAVTWHFCAPGPTARAARRAGAALGDPHPAIRSPAAHLLPTLRALQPDLLHAFDLVFYPHLLGLGALGLPLVAHFHGGAAARRPAWRAAERLALRRVDRLLFTTVTQAEGWVQNGYPADRVRAVMETSVEGPSVSGRGPRPDPPGPASPGPASTGPAASRPTSAPRLLAVGRLDAVKDPLTTLDAFARLRAAHPDATLELCWTAAPLHDAVLERARVIGPAVRLLGRLSPAATRARIANADALLQASVREVCGVAVLEAMAAGTPPVVTDIPAFRAVLGDCGGLFPVGDAAAMAAQVTRVLADPGQRARCRARFDAALSFDALAAHVAAIYAEVLGDDRA